MGLDTSHGCWHGSYNAFNRWRRAVARTIGIELDTMAGFSEYAAGTSWDVLKPDPLHKLLNHSDCDGVIEAGDCTAIAARLEEVLPKVGEGMESCGHIDDWQKVTQRFIDGLRLAASKGEDVEFH